MSNKQFIKDLQEKDQIKSVFIATDKVIMTDRNGKNYLSLNIKDATGSMNARMWDRADEYEGSFQSGDFVWVKGHVQVYQNRRQVVLHDIKPAPESDYNLDDFINGTEKSVDDLWKDYLEYLDSIEDPHIETFLKNISQNPEFQNLLKKAPAAKSIHHAYMGGLLEHIISICGLMDAVASHYSWLNRDYLIFGAIFHDIGKVEELVFESGIQYSDKGKLVGHMNIACSYIDKYSQDIDGMTELKRDILKHIVLSHHGKLEYGSPKLPFFPEAMIVAMIDDLDSKLNTIFKFMESELEGGESWSRFHQGFERYFYLDIFREKLTNSK